VALEVGVLGTTVGGRYGIVATGLTCDRFVEPTVPLQPLSMMTPRATKHPSNTTRHDRSFIIEFGAETPSLRPEAEAPLLSDNCSRPIAEELNNIVPEFLVSFL
jgi:hypothetical protein